MTELNEKALLEASTKLLYIEDKKLGVVETAAQTIKAYLAALPQPDYEGMVEKVKSAMGLIELPDGHARENPRNWYITLASELIGENALELLAKAAIKAMGEDNASV